MDSLFKIRSTFQGKNLLPQEQILPKSRPLIKKGGKNYYERVVAPESVHIHFQENVILSIW